MTDTLVIPSPFDAHVHLRQGDLQSLVVPAVEEGGVHLAYVMPNLIPPLTTTEASMSYLTTLKSLSPTVTFLPTLYLSTSLTGPLIKEANKAGIVGVKSYPRGVTTNSEGGVGMEGYAVFDEVFGAMEEVDMVLNLHGEVPSDVDGDGTCVLNAEERFLPHLIEINKKFPKLRIVLEHCTTKAAIDCVRPALLISSATRRFSKLATRNSSQVTSLPSNVVATITPHHLSLTIDTAISSSLNFCKPVAKYPSDRTALRHAIVSRNPKFFLGSDSAPHPSGAKLPQLTHDHSATGEKSVSLPSPCAAGIYTSPILLPLLATIFESAKIPLDCLSGFASTYGREFYGYPAEEGRNVTLKRGAQVVKKAYGYTIGEDKEEWVVPFMAGEKLGWVIA